MSLLRNLLAAAFLVGLQNAADARHDALIQAPLRLIEIPVSARPISAWRAMCERFPQECRIDLDEPEQVNLTENVSQLIRHINETVNQQVKPLLDISHWGVADQWDFAEDGYGDCEDYQLLKRRLLVQAGIPHRAMRMTVVIDETGQGHAVLTVRTHLGDFILDNRTDLVLAWNDTGYQFVKREGSFPDLKWVALSNEPANETATKK